MDLESPFPERRPPLWGIFLHASFSLFTLSQDPELASAAWTSVSHEHQKVKKRLPPLFLFVRPRTRTENQRPLALGDDEGLDEAERVVGQLGAAEVFQSRIIHRVDQLVGFQFAA